MLIALPFFFTPLPLFSSLSPFATCFVFYKQIYIHQLGMFVVVCASCRLVADLLFLYAFLVPSSWMLCDIVQVVVASNMEESHHASSSSSRDQRNPSSYAWRHHHHPNSDRNSQPGYGQEVKHITQYASHQSHRVADSTTTPLMGTLLPPRGLPGMRVFVYLPISFLQHGRHFKLGFNRTLVDTQLTYAGDVVTLTACVPYREGTQAQNNIVHVTLCLVDGQDVRNQWDLGEFVYEQQPYVYSEPWSTHPIYPLAASQKGKSSSSCMNVLSSYLSPIPWCVWHRIIGVTFMQQQQ